jgi:hypothetical protein
MALRVAVAVFAGVLAWPAQPVLAQGFLQPFFGNGPPPRLYGYPGPRPYPYLGPSPYRSLYLWPSPPPFGLQPPERRDEGAFGRPGTYRTMCVRLCDGFYFPVSGATNGAGLSRDADACSASCGVEARLFYHPNRGGDVDSMVDLTGIAYSTLPNAFRYRKTLVPECRCRPQPWSDAELQRHRAYAEGRPAAAATDTSIPTPPLARESRIPSGDAPNIVERPEPIARESGPQQWPPAETRYGRPSHSRYIGSPGRRD